MNKSSIVHVYPGGESACLDPSTPYYFEVKPGDADKLLISFQGGGACWEKLIVDIGLCTTSVTHDNWHGLLNYENMQNPYRSYTMVKILYCSGDMHAGDTEQPWGKSGEMLQLRGYRNAGAAVSWALANFPHLTDLTLIGQSAGSLGVQWWARRMLQSFKACGRRHSGARRNSEAQAFTDPVMRRSVRIAGQRSGRNLRMVRQQRPKASGILRHTRDARGRCGCRATSGARGLLWLPGDRVVVRGGAWVCARRRIPLCSCSVRWAERRQSGTHTLQSYGALEGRREVPATV